MSGGADAAKGGTSGILTSLVHFFGLLAAAEALPNAGPQPCPQANRRAGAGVTSPLAREIAVLKVILKINFCGFMKIVNLPSKSLLCGRTHQSLRTYPSL